MDPFEDSADILWTPPQVEDLFLGGINFLRVFILFSHQNKVDAFLCFIILEINPS